MHSVIHWLGTFSLLRGLTEHTTLGTPRGLHAEEVFHRLIHRESARSERSGHHCRVLLVYHVNEQGHVLPLTSDLADKIISLLSASLRATDSIGWYRDGYIVGGLLAALQPDTAIDGYGNLTTRLMNGLRGAISSTDDRSLNIRLIEPGELTALEALQTVKRRS